MSDEQRDSPQYAIPLGLMFGFTTAAVLCLGYAWLHRNPELALRPDPGAISSVLWRTTVVVALSVVVVVGCFAAGRLHRQTFGRRARFLAYVSPALAIAAFSGLLMLRQGRTKEVFDAAAEAQESLVPFDLTLVARWAWWCACLAVMALALVAVVSYAAQPSLGALFVSPVLAGAVAVAVVIVVAVSMVATGSSSIPHQTAERIDAPTEPAPTGEVGYRVTEPGSQPIPAGAGFVRARATKTGGYSNVYTVEGYDGSTGKRRWYYGPLDDLSVLGSTGVGPESVALARWGNILIGIDATTGTLLWFKPGQTTWDFDEIRRGFSSSVILAVRADSQSAGASGTVWEALAPRTGEVLWSKTFRYGCHRSAELADELVTVRSCDDAPDVVAEVLDARTGEPTGVIPVSLFGVRPDEVRDPAGAIGVSDASGEMAVVTVTRYRPQRIDTRFVINLRSKEVVRRLSDQSGPAWFVDAGSLIVTQSRGRDKRPAQSILVLSTGAALPLGFGSEVTGGGEGFSMVTRVGNTWWTTIPADEQTSPTRSSPLRSLDQSGATRSYSPPCSDSMIRAPGITGIPGALLVYCTDSDWAAVR